MQNSFYDVRTCPENPKWEQANKREIPIYGRNNEIRSEFERDYTRILHSQAYRRLKHKTQVFFAPHNDHICTRMEHVMHVASVATTIAKYLGLNENLAGAIAMEKTASTSFWNRKKDRTLLKNSGTSAIPFSLQILLRLCQTLTDTNSL